MLGTNWSATMISMLFLGDWGTTKVTVIVHELVGVDRMEGRSTVMLVGHGKQVASSHADVVDGDGHVSIHPKGPGPTFVLHRVHGDGDATLGSKDVGLTDGGGGCRQECILSVGLAERMEPMPAQWFEAGCPEGAMCIPDFIEIAAQHADIDSGHAGVITLRDT